MRKASVALYFDYEIGEFVRTLQQQLMRGLCGNAHDVARAQFAPDTPGDGAVALLVRIDVLRAFESSADNERGRPGLDEENVGFGFMPFGNTVGFAPGK